MHLLKLITMRLDVYLAERGYTDSRSEAKIFIQDGAVCVNSEIVTKPSYIVDETDTVSVDKSKKKYVSRGGVKLEGALDEFDINVNGKLALDIGASSGGFTDCLLKRGANHVIAVDTGYGQLSKSLATNEHVTSIENFNARYMKPYDLQYAPNLVVMDVSFISATRIIPAIFRCMDDMGDFICLIKPQFEVGKNGVGKGGIVKDEKKRKEAVNSVIDFAKSCGFSFKALIRSPIKGGDGNIEYLAHFIKEKIANEEIVANSQS